MAQLRIHTLAALLILASCAAAQVTLYPVPPEIQSQHFSATINGRAAAVTHAATSYHCLSFDLAGTAEIAITAPTDDYWATGIEVQPWRLNIRPTVVGRVARFKLSGPAKLSITRPGDHMATSEMLFLFANAPERDAPRAGAAGVRYYGPGVYHENIDARSGDRIYLAAGAVVFGSLNLWDVEDVKVSGRGTLIYDGPQNPANDEGWMHRKNWHVIVSDQARNVEISGITCIVRSRTWMIQMQNSRHLTFDNVKVIGGCPGNANQDGMDWLGGGDTLVRDCFFRASDDVFALYGNWLGYGRQAQRTPGEDVTNIRIENSVISTSISNVVRVSWPQKIFNSGDFVMRDSDVIHMGIGGCGIPFALFEIWADQNAEGRHAGYSLENIRLEDWYALLQVRQPNAAVRDITLRNIWALEQPALESSVLLGDVAGVRLDNVNLAGTPARTAGDLPLLVQQGAQPPEMVEGDGPRAVFTVAPGAIRPRQAVTFDARGSRAKGRMARYEWLFGDGTGATGARVRHAFPDTAGTLRDGTGRFRVLLKVTDGEGHSDWLYRPVVVAGALQPAATLAAANLAPGLAYRYYEGTFPRLPDFDALTPSASGTSSGLEPAPGQRANDFALIHEGYVDVPADGGYVFLLTSRDGGKLELDGQIVVASPAPVAQVCGSVGNAVQAVTGVRALRAGKHAIRVSMTQGKGTGGFTLKWQTSGSAAQEIPAAAFFHQVP